MDNPVFFTVLTADVEGLALTDAGILGSRAAAETEASRRHDRLPGLLHVAAIVTLQDQDPATGTPIPHLQPVNARGYALASLSVAEPARRYLVPGAPIFDHLELAQAAARVARSRSLERGSTAVRDVVALTVIKDSAQNQPNPIPATSAERTTSRDTFRVRSQDINS